MRIAILADIHGNLAALERVMVELERLQPDHVVVNGDLILGAPHSVQVVDLARRNNWIVVRGNHEFYYLDLGTPRAVDGSDDPARWGQLHWLAKQMTPVHGAYLGTLPDEQTLYIPGTQAIGVAHGVPGRNRVGFYPEQSASSIAIELDHVHTATFISAHSHLQIDRHISTVPEYSENGSAHPPTTEAQHRGSGAPSVHRHWHLINPGSVGLPLNGDPTTQFAIIESVPESKSVGGWQATHIRLEYDRRPTLESFHTSGLAEVGGVISQLLYWEIVTAEQEIIGFFQWGRTNGYDSENDLVQSFRAYCQKTGRDAYVRSRDPLFHPQLK